MGQAFSLSKLGTLRPNVSFGFAMHRTENLDPIHNGSFQAESSTKLELGTRRLRGASHHPISQLTAFIILWLLLKYCGDRIDNTTEPGAARR
jgi:hypothetical protein